jgi:hypothetical protein
VRRTQARDAATFLIDQNRGIVAAHGGAQIADQGAHLIRARAVAGEQDEAPRVGLVQQPPLIGAERASGDTDNRGRDRPRRLNAGRQSSWHHAA